MSLAFHADDGVQAWNLLGRRRHMVARPRFAEDVRPLADEGGQRLGIGARRSYSDVGLADGGRLVDMTGLDRFRGFDPASGILTADPGVTLGQILATFVPRGWFLPVTPGTRFVTLGGAVANDVHGKNHRRAGTFGSHVTGLGLVRSDGAALRPSPSSEPALFAATIGGLGLTGLVTEVSVRLQRIGSAWLDVETIACPDLAALCATLRTGEASAEHGVAWIDCTASGGALGRGIVSLANWSAEGDLSPHRARQRLGVPTRRTGGLLNPLTLRLLNQAYYQAGRLKAGRRHVHYAPFFHPLDAIGGWNRLYGARGFRQYQCLVPDAAGTAPVAELLRVIAASGEGSFLAVLKRFGAAASPGLLSFPAPGLTLALDFRDRGDETLALFARLDAIVAAAGGRLYPAKDGRLPASLMPGGEEAMARFRPFVDPACVSDFAKRVGL